MLLGLFKESVVMSWKLPKLSRKDRVSCTKPPPAFTTTPPLQANEINRQSETTHFLAEPTAPTTSPPQTPQSFQPRIRYLDLIDRTIAAEAISVLAHVYYLFSWGHLFIIEAPLRNYIAECTCSQLEYRQRNAEPRPTFQR